MGGYQYLVSSLPALSLEAPPPFAPAEFRFKCQGVLSEADLAELDLLLAGRAAEGARRFRGRGRPATRRSATRRPRCAGRSWGWRRSRS
jgi:hypothetical protein